MFCLKCGAMIPNESNFCLKCGSIVTGVQPSEITPQPPKADSANINETHVSKEVLPSQRTINRLRPSVILVLIIIIIVIFAIINNRVDEIPGKNQLTTQETNELQTLLERNDFGPEYFDIFKQWIDSLPEYAELTEKRQYYHEEYEKRLKLFYSEELEKWENEYDIADYSIEAIANDLRNTLGFDYNNKDMSDEFLIRQDFNDLMDKFNYTASELRAQFNPPLTQIKPLADLVQRNEVTNDDADIIIRYYSDLQACENKINSVNY